MSEAAIWWIRRDLRLLDQPALIAAAAAGSVVPLFVLDDHLLRSSGEPRRDFLARVLTGLDDELRRQGSSLVTRSGDPVEVVPRVAAEAGAGSVHVSADFGPYGQRRDSAVEDALDVPLVRTGSPYAVSPGRVTTKSGSPYQVFTPFYRAWLRHGWRAPADVDLKAIAWQTLPSDPLPPTSGEAVTEEDDRQAWETFREERLADYPDRRDRPDLDGTSRVSVFLRWGLLHPRTLLADLGPDDEVFRKELAWREFYAAVLAHWPASAREYF
ncbi:MAG: deoxyribodipyrimidine photo-lyase, partial [Marmoricola sp.]